MRKVDLNIQNFLAASSTLLRKLLRSDSSQVWLVGHGLDPLYQHVAAEWAAFCHRDDAEKRKYSALWSLALIKDHFDVGKQAQESPFMPRYGSSGYNRVGAEAVARFGIIFGKTQMSLNSVTSIHILDPTP